MKGLPFIEGNGIATIHPTLMSH